MTKAIAASRAGVLALALATGGVAMGSERITLVGASIGEAWKLGSLGERVSVPGYTFAYAGVYAFDKGPIIARVLAAGEKPTVLALKECATYFPGDQAAYERSVAAWVAEIRRAGVEPLLVTTAPVGAPSGVVERAKAFTKSVLGRSTAHDGLVAFNDWLKEYAKREGIAVFDLEAVLRVSPGERWLRPEFDSGDRVHLTPAAYAAMDRAFADFLGARAQRAVR
jgi:hypothetical protein